MKIKSEAVDGLIEFKGYDFDLTDAREAYKYDDVVQKIGECVGRVYGKEMKALVISNFEAAYTTPTYPTGDDLTDEKKSIWNKEYDLYMKKLDLCEDWKAKVFVVVYGRCTKAMKNCIEKLGNFEDIEKDYDVVELLKMIKRQIFEANERKYSSLWMVQAWKKLLTCKQNDDEDLIDYYQRFVGLVQVVEIAYGNISPQGNDKKEQRKFIAFIFMDGADKKQYGCLMKSLETDHSLGKTDVHPDGIESALHLLILYSEIALKKKKKKKQVTMVQAGACWECGSTDHYKKDCPKYKAKMMEKERRMITPLPHYCRQVGVRAGTCQA